MEIPEERVFQAKTKAKHAGRQGRHFLRTERTTTWQVSKTNKERSERDIRGVSDDIRERMARGRTAGPGPL